jgi:hypothetical protein
MGKSMVSGFNCPNKTNPLNRSAWDVDFIHSYQDYQEMPSGKLT